MVLDVALGVLAVSVVLLLLFIARGDAVAKFLIVQNVTCWSDLENSNGTASECCDRKLSRTFGMRYDLTSPLSLGQKLKLVPEFCSTT